MSTRTLGIALGGALLLPLFASCAGESQREERRAPARGGKAGGAGHKSAGAAGCTSCGTGGGGRASTGGAAGTGARGGSDAGRESGAGRASSAGGATSGGESAGGRAPAGGNAGESEGGAGGETPLGGTLRITKLAAYQGVEVVLSRNGVAEPPNAPIIADRELMLRAWVEPGVDFTPRNVDAELTITSGGATRRISIPHTIDAPSDDTVLASTLNFTLRASDVTLATTLSLSIREVTPAGTELARWPATDAQVLNATSSAGPLQITLVPLVTGGFTPDLGSENLARFSRYMNRLYPASRVDMTVRAAHALRFAVEPAGDGWDEALDELYALRDEDDPEPNVYYYGVLTPGATFDDYCSVDCVVGLSVVAGRNDAYSRGSIGTGYFEDARDTFSQETLAHELGHAMGREHAPCGDPDYPDQSYPYAAGLIGVNGYDGLSLVEPGENFDVMGYCVPVWISDYTWNALFSRVSYVNGLAAKEVPLPRASRAKQRTLIVGQDGQLRWGREQAPATPPSGEPVLVELLDESGAVLDVITAPFRPFDHLSGGFLSVPLEALARTGADSVRVAGERVPIR